MADKDSEQKGGAPDKAAKDAKPDKADKAVKEPEASGGFSLAQFFQESKEELAKVVWPSRQQLISESAAVLLMVVFSALLIYAVDSLFSLIATRIFAS